MQINYERPSLTSYQKAILDSPARYTITAASTKTGKTASHIIWLFEQALLLKPNQAVWWVAPVYQQAEIAFRRMKNQVNIPNFFHTNESKLVLTTPIGSRIEFKSAEKPDNLYGDDVYAAVFDEASRAREESWYALRSTLTATQGKCKLIGNVKGKKNWFYKIGERAKSGDPNMEYFKITAYDAVKEGIYKRMK
jgi:phage FluMu gp28-like protein